MTYHGEVITSSQNKYVSLARSLDDKKGRQKNRLYRFDGVKLMCEALSKGVELEFILVSDLLYGAVFSKARELYGLDRESIECRVIVVQHSIFERLSEENAPEGVISVAKYDDARHREIAACDLDEISADENILILESVRDPQNVGAVMRAAAAFNVSLVILSRDCADIYGSKTLRASMGTFFSLKTARVDSIPEAVSKLRSLGRRVYSAALDRDAQRLGEMTVMRGDCVIIGNEGHGISSDTIEASSGCVYIPMADGVESLNAATAAAVLLWEFFGSSAKAI